MCNHSGDSLYTRLMTLTGTGVSLLWFSCSSSTLQQTRSSSQLLMNRIGGGNACSTLQPLGWDLMPKAGPKWWATSSRGASLQGWSFPLDRRDCISSSCPPRTLPPPKPACCAAGWPPPSPPWQWSCPPVPSATLTEFPFQSIWQQGTPSRP